MISGNVDLTGMVPRFIRDDRNGYALTKALEAGVNEFVTTARGALAVWGDVDEMPGWRLDELAWEYDIPYDQDADIEVRREWIRGAYVNYRLYGTPAGVEAYMAQYFGEARVDEGWQYGGDPYHYRVTVPGDWTLAGVQWAERAAALVQNARSVMDGLYFDKTLRRALFQGGALYGEEECAVTVPGIGTVPTWYTDEAGNMLIDEEGMVLTVS